MSKISYRIQSKIMGADGKPDFVKFGVTDNIEQTIKFHIFHLKHRTHPDPQLMRYTCSRGVDVLEFIVDAPAESLVDPLVEKAMIQPEKETRGKKKKSG